ncbi:unnamed protein product [marine sediment metagenome]|uniref:Uncharacterized protein n=1 Tax=marine sediment metagenome TaxID=412755 RepID=X1IFZ1_9ZZZZ
MRAVEINYNPEIQIDNEKHEIWERVVNKYHLMSIGSDNGSCKLLIPQDLNLERLVEELRPIEILSS